ncbi:hypothetical protein [Mycoplasmopsis columboralis]|uniref:Lipoprotein n=1 Tax=Mycoplasmopsis columboralis TaxID=171282 RepID=A0A449B6K3_9BACT|nr:hypothetical protein [Mycoplasmopsis columboralis]VEU76185.1 Uncharacterised protein [Mycoplasmopsis columboralis]
MNKKKLLFIPFAGIIPAAVSAACSTVAQKEVNLKEIELKIQILNADNVEIQTLDDQNVSTISAVNITIDPKYSDLVNAKDTNYQIQGNNLIVTYTLEDKNSNKQEQFTKSFLVKSTKTQSNTQSETNAPKGDVATYLEQESKLGHLHNGDYQEFVLQLFKYIDFQGKDKVLSYPVINDFYQKQILPLTSKYFINEIEDTTFWNTKVTELSNSLNDINLQNVKVYTQLKILNEISDKINEMKLFKNQNLTLPNFISYSSYKKTYLDPLLEDELFNLDEQIKSKYLPVLLENESELIQLDEGDPDSEYKTYIQEYLTREQLSKVLTVEYVNEGIELINKIKNELAAKHQSDLSEQALNSTQLENVKLVQKAFEFINRKTLNYDFYLADIALSQLSRTHLEFSKYLLDYHQGQIENIENLLLNATDKLHNQKIVDFTVNNLKDYINKNVEFLAEKIKTHFFDSVNDLYSFIYQSKAILSASDFNLDSQNVQNLLDEYRSQYQFLKTNEQQIPQSEENTKLLELVNQHSQVLESIFEVQQPSVYVYQHTAPVTNILEAQNYLLYSLDKKVYQAIVQLNNNFEEAEKQRIRLAINNTIDEYIREIDAFLDSNNSESFLHTYQNRTSDSYYTNDQLSEDVAILNEVNNYLNTLKGQLNSKKEDRSFNSLEELRDFFAQHYINYTFDSITKYPQKTNIQLHDLINEFAQKTLTVEQRQILNNKIGSLDQYTQKTVQMYHQELEDLYNQKVQYTNNFDENEYSRDDLRSDINLLKEIYTQAKANKETLSSVLNSDSYTEKIQSFESSWTQHSFIREQLQSNPKWAKYQDSNLNSSQIASQIREKIDSLEQTWKTQTQSRLQNKVNSTNTYIRNLASYIRIVQDSNFNNRLRSKPNALRYFIQNQRVLISALNETLPYASSNLRYVNLLIQEGNSTQNNDGLEVWRTGFVNSIMSQENVNASNKEILSSNHTSKLVKYFVSAELLATETNKDAKNANDMWVEFVRLLNE